MPANIWIIREPQLSKSSYSGLESKENNKLELPMIQAILKDALWNALGGFALA